MRQITAIAFRLLALWLLIQVVLNLTTLAFLLLNFEQQQQNKVSAAAYASFGTVITLIGLLAVYLLYKTSASVLERMKQGSDISQSHETQMLLFQLGGLYFTVLALAQIPRSVLIMFNDDPTMLINIFAVIGQVFQLGIGVWLMTSSRFWHGLFIKLRGRD